MATPMGTALDRLYRAWTVPGAHPDYHKAQMDRLKKEWPSLWVACRDVVEAMRAEGSNGS